MPAVLNPASAPKAMVVRTADAEMPIQLVPQSNSPGGYRVRAISGQDLDHSEAACDETQR